MFCALHAVAAFGALLVVCSLARANAVRLRVQLHPSPVQSSGPAAVSFFFFSFSLCCQAPGASPVFPARWNLPQPACVPRCTLCPQRLPWRIPAGFSPPFYSFPGSPALQTKPPRAVFLAASCQRVKLVLFILFPRFVSFGSSLSRKPWFCFPAVSIFFLSPISVACFSKCSDLFLISLPWNLRLPSLFLFFSKPWF